MSSHGAGQIVHVMKEDRVFPPPGDFAAKARIGSMAEYEKLCREAAEDLEGFWGRMADELHWFEPFQKGAPVGRAAGQVVRGREDERLLQLPRHSPSNPAAEQSRPDLGGRARRDPRADLPDAARRGLPLCQRAEEAGRGRGDVVSIYMPLVPELAIAMLACAGSAQSMRDLRRLLRRGHRRAEQQRRGQGDPHGRRRLAPRQAIALEGERRRRLAEVADGREVRRAPPHRQRRDDDPRPRLLVARIDRGGRQRLPRRALDSETPLFILYTSGSTGKPKGILHTTAGYNLFAKKTTEWVFDVRDDDIYWCTADMGWITGHSYVVYGPLSAGATVFIYEGAPDAPDCGRWWQMIEKHRINILYTAPTAIRTFIKWGDPLAGEVDLSSLRLLGSVGEGINPEAWMWYHEKVGGGRCPIVDTWWQTETGGIMMSPLPGVTATKPGSCTRPLPGVFPEIVGEDRQPVSTGNGGWLVISRPWPGMLRGSGATRSGTSCNTGPRATQLSVRRQRPPR